MTTNYQNSEVAMLPAENETSVLLCTQSYTDIEDGVVEDYGVEGLLYIGATGFSRDYFQPQHLYALSDEKIEDGDWVLLSYPYGVEINQAIKGREFNNATFWNAESRLDGRNHKKIVATTNKSLGLPKFPTTLLRSYIGKHNAAQPTKISWTYDELLGNGGGSLDAFLRDSVEFTQEDREVVMETMFAYINK